MTDWQGKRYWLVGASEGLGAALAQKLSAAGAEVVGVAGPGLTVFSAAGP